MRRKGKKNICIYIQRFLSPGPLSRPQGTAGRCYFYRYESVSTCPSLSHWSISLAPSCLFCPLLGSSKIFKEYGHSSGSLGRRGVYTHSYTAWGGETDFLRQSQERLRKMRLHISCKGLEAQKALSEWSHAPDPVKAEGGITPVFVELLKSENRQFIHQIRAQGG